MIYKKFLLSCVLIFKAAFIFSQSLSGSYTIGGNSPNYATWKDAVSDLSTKGISGPVVFNVRAGTYTEQVTIPQIPGSSATNKVTFQSESKDSTSVTLTFSSNPTNPSTLQIKGADHLTFKYLTFKATNSVNARTVSLESDANDILFTNNQLIGVSNGNSSAQALFYSSGSNDTLALESNYFKNGSFGIVVESSSPENSGIRIKGNTFNNPYYRAVYLSSVDSPVVTENIVYFEGTNSGFEGMYFTYIKGAAKITNNKITASKGTGMYFTQRSGAAGVYSIVANNTISIGGSTNGDIGIYLYSPSYYSFYHNTINIYSQSTNSYALYLYYGSNLSFVNNIFANTGTGYALYRYSAQTAITSDYNNIYASGTNLAYFNEDINSLDKLKSATSSDKNSVSVNPKFVSRDDLHVSEVALFKKGKQVSEVTKDFEGESRDVNTPCIGADEFTLPALDAGIVALKKPKVPFAPGNQSVQVVIRNCGSTILSGATLQWKINSLAQTTAQWTGSLSPADSAIVDLGSFNFVAGKSYIIDAEVLSPNGGNDANLLNNKIQVTNLYPGLVGNYTIGGVSPDFNTFSEAVNALFIGGAAGPVTFNVRPGTYQEQIRIENYAGSNCDNPVVFQSENGDSSSVIIKYANTSSSNYIVSLNGVQGIKFRNMILRAAGGSYGTVFLIRGAVSCFTTEGCEISNNSGSTTSSYSRLVDIQGATNSKMLWSGNLFKGGSEGIYLSGGTNSAGTIISGNIFKDQYYMAVRMESSKSPKILGNEIKGRGSYTDYYGLYIYNCNDSLEISRNRISASGGGTGIYLYSTYGSAGKEGLVSNNFISIGGSSTCCGINLYASGYQRLYHNNVNAYGTHAEESRCFYSTSNSNTKVYNNVFSNSGAGYSVVSNSTNSTMDYNNLYSLAGKVGYYSGVRYTLSDWKSAGSWDVHSVSVDPLFTSTTDLHVNKADLDSAGVALSEVKLDIDGEKRGTLPDIGADEFTPSGKNVALLKILYPAEPFKAGTYLIQISFKNSGVSKIDSLRLGWSLSGVEQKEVVWKGSLVTGQSQTIQLGELLFAEKKRYDVSVWLKSVNGGKDIDVSDDSLFVKSIYTSLSAGTYTIGGTNPDFANFATATTVLNEGGIVGPVTFNVRPGTYQEQIRIENYAGSNCDNPVVFQSENGDSSSVIIKYANTSSSNYVVSLNGVQGIKFRNMILSAAGGSYGIVFLIRGAVSCITAEGCEISNNSGLTTSSYSRLVDMQSTTNSKMLWSGNLFKGGSEGIYLSGGSGSEGTIIKGNLFKDQYYMAVRMESSKYPKIQNNEIKGRGSYTDYYGLYFYNCTDSLEVSRNRISASGGGTGIYLYSCYGSTGKEGLVSNNFISIGGSSTCCGINSYASGYQRLYHNNVHAYGTHAEESRCLYTTSISNTKVYNNVFSNSGAGYAVVSNSTNSTMDYNNLYSAAGKVGYYLSVRYTLSDWKSAGSWDIHSVSADPLFTSTTDLHVNKADLDSAGVALSEVKLDIDGEKRGTTPDIGADEFTPSGKNAALVKILHPAEPFKSGTYPIQITFKNSGVSKIDSLRLGWSVLGVEQKEVVWKGSLATGESQTIQLGEILFAEKKRYDVSVWVKAVNGGKDIDVSDDSLFVKSIYTSLSAGAYTIGGTNPDFVNFAAATKVLTEGGILGPVTFNVRPGTYQEQIRIENFAGSQCENPVVFQSENGDSSSVIIRYVNTSSNNYVVSLNAVQGIKFRNMILRAAGGSYGNVFLIRGTVSCITVEGCELSNNSGLTTSSYSRLVDMQSTTNSKMMWSGNLFKGGSEGIYLSGGANSEGTIIRGNIFKDQYYMAVRIESSRYPKIQGNEIKGLGSYSDYYGIYLNSCNDSLDISRNRVSASGGGTGLYLYYINSSAGKEGLISNNFISIGGSNTCCGINIYSSSYQRLYHNNVNAYGTHPEESRCLFSTGISNTKVYNNVFSNSGAGYAVVCNSTNSTMDYNNLYSSAGKVGYYSGVRSTLSEWQSAGNWDVHSVSGNPLFISKTDLHVENVFLNGAGTPLKEVTQDIDGQSRDPQKPDIGADEITSSAADAGITKLITPGKPFPSGENTIQVEILNNSSEPLESVKLSLVINGNFIGTTLWKGSILPGKVTTAIVDTFNFRKDSGYTIDVKLSEPNGLADSDADNDSIRVNDLYPGLGGTYTIGGENPDFNTFAAAIQAMERGGVYDAVTFLVRSGIYKEKIKIPEIKGASEAKRIHFKPVISDSAAVILSDASNSSSANYVINLNGADYIIFEGFLIRTESANYGRVVYLDNQSGYNTFKNNIIIGRPSTSTSYNYALIYNEEGNNSTQYIGNTFINGSSGIYHAGKSGSVLEEGAIIQNNTFTNQVYNAIQIRYQMAPAITGNTISTKGASYDYSGIWFYYCSGNLLCTKNKVSSNSGNYSLKIEYCESSQAKKALVANNMFSLTTASQSSHAILLSGAQWFQLFNNTSHIKSTISENSALLIQNGGNHRILNNVLSNGGAGYAFYASSPSAIFESNYNNIYSAGANIGFWSVPRADIALWRVASAQDAQSVSANPLLVTEQDLHVRQSLLNGTAKSLTEIIDDIDGEIRSKTSPDIGADEFEYAIVRDFSIKEILSPKSACDLDTVGVVSAKVQNLSTAVLDSFTVAYELIGKGLIVKETFKQVIQPQEEKIIKFTQPLKFPYGDAFAIRVFSLQKDDIDRSNDTAKVSVINYPEVSFLISPDTSICSGKSFTLNVQGGVRRKWSTGATNASISVSPVKTTTYIAEIWNDFNCVARDSVKITVLVPDRLPEITSPSNVNFCVGDYATLTSNIQNNSNITWSTGEKRNTIEVTKSGSYFIDYKYASSCTVRSASKQVTAYEIPKIFVDGFTSICLGDSAKLIAGNATTQLWSTGQTNNTITIKPVKDTLYKVVMSNAGCSRKDSIQIKIAPAVPPGIVSGMIPSDKAIDVYLPVSLSWQPAQNATEYNIYIWPEGTTRPATPGIRRVKEINVNFSTLSYDKSYNWQVASETSCLSAEGPVQKFKVRTLPNLVTDSVKVLASPFSGQTIGVSWKVSNTGLGATSVNGTWKDDIYLSVDPTKGSSDIFLGSVDNTSALQPGGSYTNNAAVKLPEDAIGPYYILVISNYQKREIETAETDNMVVRKVDIALSPPPDAQVVEIIPPGVNGFAFSGEKIFLTYSVKNMGTGSIKETTWRDLIQWSPSEVYDPSKMYNVGNIYHANELLLPGESSRKSIEVKLPENYAGTIYFYVTTDASDDIFEHLDEDNNRTRSQPLDVIMTPPPDLEIVGCDFGLPVFSAQSVFTVQYKTVNDGGSATTKTNWKDSLYLSPVKKITAESIPIGAIKNGISILNADAIATVNYSVRLKNFNEGKYFLIIKTDVGDLIYEGNNEKNNIYIHEDTIFVRNPDLTISEASVSDAKPATGDKVHVSWTVKNAGNIAMLAQPKFDKIYVSAKNKLDSTAAKVGELNWNTVIASGTSTTFDAEITLPLKFINGVHYIHIVSDAQDSVYEANEANNLYSFPIEIKVAPWADLVPQSITGLPKNMRAGIKFPISFTVTNKGDSEAKADVWVDKLYGSISRKWHPDSVVLIAEFPRYLPLGPGESYTVSEDVAFPMLGKFQIGLDSFAYIHTYLYVDSSNHVFEYKAKGNNIFKGDSVLVRCPPHTNFNLNDARTNAPDTVNEAETYTLNWEVINLGNTTKLWNYKLWYDGLYLSKDTIFDKDKDLFIYDWTISGPVGLEEIYSKYQTFKIPYDHFGDYYLIMVVDHKDYIHDADNHSPRSPLQATAGHKRKVVRTASGQPKMIHIQRIRKPELQIAFFKVPETAIAGQPVKLEWKITNNGDLPVAVPFTDNFILTSNLTETGNSLGVYTHNKKLAAGESYTVSKEFFLPVTASGNYFIVLNTDANKLIYESAAGEENNRAYYNISVIQQTPSDLIISSVKVDKSQINVEETVTLEYVAKNIGIYAAKGLRKDHVYLSKDKTFDPNDLLVSNEQYNDEILPYQEKIKTTKVKIPGIIPGNYYVIVVIDATNNILESTDDNNFIVTPAAINIQLQEITIGVQVEMVLENKKDKVYAIKVPKKYAGETLIITLDTDVYPALNELYLSKDKIPDASNADYTYLNANSGDQKLLIESLEEGIYYLLIKGSAQKVAKQNVKLLASILPFEIRSVDANQGGNTGNVTLNIEGAKFDRSMIAKLVMGTKVIFANKVYFSNSTKVYATFNLKGVPLGVYDVVLIKGTENAIYPQGFSVVEGSLGNSSASGGESNQNFSCNITYNKGVGNLLDQELDYPSAVRRNRTVEINIYYKNNGNVDMEVPSRFLLSVSGHPVSSTIDGLKDMNQDLFLEFKEKDGPPGILRPGAQGVMRAYTRSYTSGGFIELILED